MDITLRVSDCEELSGGLLTVLPTSEKLFQSCQAAAEEPFREERENVLHCVRKLKEDWLVIPVQATVPHRG